MDGEPHPPGTRMPTMHTLAGRDRGIFIAYVLVLSVHITGVRVYSTMITRSVMQAVRLV